MNDHAVGGFKQRQFDKILAPDEAAGGRRCGDHEQRVAGVGIEQPMQDAGASEGNADIGERRIGDVALHRQRQRRRLNPVGECHGPAHCTVTTVAFKRRHLRAIETDADRLALLQRHTTDVADNSTTLGADRFDVDGRGLVEHQPYGVGAAKQRRGRRGGKGKFYVQAFAVAQRLDRSRLVAGSAFRWMLGRGRLHFLRCRRGSQGFLRRRNLLGCRRGVVSYGA